MIGVGSCKKGFTHALTSVFFCNKKTGYKLVRGFTLIELLVVISIIGLLSSVVLASLKEAQVKAKISKTLTEMKQFQYALELFRNDNGHYPGANPIYFGVMIITDTIILRIQVLRVL